MTPQSGFTYAAGRANGLPFVTQPARSLVLYWYQSTPSVTGITGMSLTMMAWSRLTIWCCVAESLVAAYCSISLSACGFEYRSQSEPADFPIGAEPFEYRNERSS